MNRISTIQGHGQPGCRRADRGGAAAHSMAALLKRVFIFIALMLTTASGAWAQTESLLTTITPDGSGNPVYSVANKATIAKDGILYNGYWFATTACNLTVTACEGIVITKVKFTTNKDATWEDTAAPFQVKLYMITVYDSSDKTITSGGGVSRIDVYGYEASAGPTGYSVTLASGTEDAENWVITPNEGIEEGTEVTIQYSGTRRIKSITAEQAAASVKEAAATPNIAQADCTFSPTNGTSTLSNANITTAMEYSSDNGTTWTDVTSNGSIASLAAGTVQIRVKETDDKRASEAVSITVPQVLKINELVGPYTGDRLTCEYYAGETWQALVDRYDLIKVYSGKAAFSTDGFIYDESGSAVPVTDLVDNTETYEVQ